MALNISTLNKIKEIFTVNRWEIDHDVFNRYCKMLESMTDEQQSLILELTRNYMWLDLSWYQSKIKLALSDLEQYDLSDVKSIYILPLSSKDDFGKSKSSTTVSYLFKDASLSNHRVFNNKRVTCLDPPTEERSGLPQNLAAKPCLILLVDDFIGSGETAVSALAYWTDEKDIPKDKIIVLAIAAQTIGLQRVREFGVRVVSSVERSKGISDNDSYTSLQKQTFKALMTEIEDRLQVEDKFRFGYEASEALITMIRTPNNTFPVFWLEKHNPHQVNSVAPFPR